MYKYDYYERLTNGYTYMLKINMEPHEIQYEGKYEVGGAMEKNAGVRFFVYSFNLV